ncbi:MAG: beta-lactamase family protein [Phycisphaerales bacterium]|nr:beta-lactamase family protein [Hyphomonadaceae bacterium]
MHRRYFLAGAAACLATPAYAQNLNFQAAAAYSAERRGVAVLVMHDGRAIFEDYPNGGGAAEGHELASGTKSFTGIIAAAAVQDRLLRWDEPCADTLTEWRSDDRRRITIRDLLSLTSGVEGGPIARPPNYADAIAAQSGAAPGARFAYGPTPFQIFGEIIKRKTSGDPLAYLQRRVFEPLGISPTHWRRGADGNPHMPSGAGLTARDWARFGWLVMQNGEGRLDAEALAQCFNGTRANPGYGLSWWLWREGLVAPGRTQSVDVDPALTRQFGPIHMAAGAGDQRLYLLPQQRLVVARQATGIMRALLRRNRDENPWSDAAFLRTLLNA